MITITMIIVIIIVIMISNNKNDNDKRKLAHYIHRYTNIPEQMPIYLHAK